MKKILYLFTIILLTASCSIPYYMQDDVYYRSTSGPLSDNYIETKAIETYTPNDEVTPNNEIEYAVNVIETTPEIYIEFGYNCSPFYYNYNYSPWYSVNYYDYSWYYTPYWYSSYWYTPYWYSSYYYTPYWYSYWYPPYWHWNHHWNHYNDWNYANNNRYYGPRKNRSGDNVPNIRPPRNNRVEKPNVQKPKIIAQPKIQKERYTQPKIQKERYNKPTQTKRRTVQPKVYKRQTNKNKNYSRPQKTARKTQKYTSPRKNNSRSYSTPRRSTPTKSTPSRSTPSRSSRGRR